jgi:cystathionine beta-lyase/cystathionine gamma-synthase
MDTTRRLTIQQVGANFLRQHCANLSPQEYALIEIDAYLKRAPFPTNPNTHAIGGLSNARAVAYAVTDHGNDIGLPLGRDGVAYGRYVDSPAQTVLEEALSFIAQGVETGEIQGGTGDHYERPLAVAMPSGMSTLTHILHLLQNIKDKRDISIIVAPDDCYGGTRSLIKELGIKVVYAQDSTEAALQAAYEQQGGQTHAIIFETLTNPFTHVADIDTIVSFAKNRDIITIADSTLAPFSRPVLRGVDVDTISLTKYCAENQAIAGGIIFNKDRKDLLERFIAYRNRSGGIPGAQEIILALNGLTTLVDSYKSHSRNAACLAEWLLQQPQISRIYYPGYGEYPQTALAEKYLGNFRGGLMTIELKGGFPAVQAFIEATPIPLAGYGEGLPDEKRQLIRVADSFGLPVTVVNYMPTQMSRYRGMSLDECRAAGITEGTLRVAIGTQDARLIIAAFAQSLAAIPETSLSNRKTESSSAVPINQYGR